MTSRRGLARSFAMLAVAALMSGTAIAQNFGPLLGSEIPFDVDRGRNVGVLDRPRPELDPLGIRAGAFLIFPKLDLGVGYTNNVYGSLNGRQGDGFTTIAPQVTAQSQWSRNSLNLTARGAFKRFFNQSPKNEDGYGVSANGRVDVTGNDRIEAVASYERGYEAQYSGAFPANSAESIAFDRMSGILRGTIETNRIRLIGNVDINSFDFKDSRSLTGVRLDQDFRDRTLSRGSVRGEYAVSPDAAAFVQATWLDSHYDNRSLVGANRSSTEQRILGGFTFDLSSLVRASVGVGYVHRDYDDAVYSTINDVAADIRLSYFFSPLTTLTLAVRRDVEDAIVSRSPGYVATRVQARVDHELLRSVLPFIQGDYEHNAFKDIRRQDDQYRIRAGVTYTANRNWQLIPEASYIKRTSRGEQIGQAFNELQFMVRLIGFR